LIENGFNYGCVTESDTVTIQTTIFGAGVSLEVINDNKNRTIPESQSGPGSVMGKGLKTVHDVTHHVSFTHDGRGVKAVLYKHAEGYHLKEVNITFINVGGFAPDVCAKINRSLPGRSGDVIIVFGEEVSGSSVRRGADEAQKGEFSGRFAIVTAQWNIPFLGDLKANLPKLVGCFSSPEEAIAALRSERSPQPLPRGGRMRVFVGSSTEAKNWLGKVSTWMADVEGVEVLRWDNEELFPLGESTWTSLINIANRVDAAVFIMSPDDRTMHRNKILEKPRDNVILEYGLFSGILGHNKVVMFVADAELASDLSGITYADFKNEHRARHTIQLWLENLPKRQPSR
jgi:predicted nucleotide-binding protein